MKMDIATLRKYAVRHILRRVPAEHLLRHALCKHWESSTELDELAWTDYNKLYFNFPRLEAQMAGAAAENEALGKPLDPGDYTIAYLAALAHEISHVLWMHNVRSKGKNLEVWSVACEYAINHELSAYFGDRWISHLRVMQPPSSLINLLHQCNLPPTTDNIYNKLIDNPVYMPNPNMGKTPCGYCIRNTGSEEVDHHQLIKVLNSLPPDSEERNDIIRFVIAHQTEPRDMPWEMLLLGGIEDAVNQEHTWTRPSRRNDLMPGWQHEKMLSFVWILDVSPSIDDEMKKSFMNTVQAGINLYHDALHRIIFFADTVEGDITVSSGTDLSRVEIPCGGGTDLTDVWEILEKDLPEYALVLTDLELYAVPEPSYTKIIWGVVGNSPIFNPDYGIRIDLK